MDTYADWPYKRTPRQIVDLYRVRTNERSPVVRAMETLRDHYNGDVIVPLPELDKDEKAAVANLVQQGLDNYGMRIASVLPNLTCPPMDPRKPTSVKKAETKRRAMLGWWEANKINLQVKRRARYYIGYGMQAVTLRPDFERGIARWELRNPLTAFPAPCSNPDDITPSDAVYATRRPLRFIKQMWPLKWRQIADEDQSDDTQFAVLEYDDAEQITMIALNPGKLNQLDSYEYGGKAAYVVLETVPNRAGCPLSVASGRITLDRPAGQFDGILGMYQAQAKLMALEVLAVQRGVFPDTYLISRPNEQARFVSGPHPNGSGLINEIEGGDIHEVAPNPGFATNGTIDRLERAQRLTGGIPADFGGESGTNIRTGRRGQDVLAAVVDFPIQEAQEVLAACLEEENYRACKIAQSYFGSRSVSFHVQWKGARGPVTYRADDFDSCYSKVSYTMAGADLNNYVVAGGQRVGIGTMSKQRFMELDPYIEDPDMEMDRVTAEGLDQALLQGLQNQAASGGLPPSDLARIKQLVMQQNVDLAEAVLMAQQEAQERQAQQVPPTAPEAQPGLALPGAGAEAGVAIPEQGPSLENLSQLLQSLRAG